MINLLSNDHKLNIRAARQNVVLRRYVNSLIIVLILMLASFGAGYALVTLAHNEAMQEREANEQAVAQYAAVEKEATAFAANLASAKAILGSEVLFSKLMVDIAKTLPSGSVLASLSITTDNIGTEPISITARTVDAGPTPIALKSALEASPLFEDVRLENINREATTEESSALAQKYPVSVTLFVTVSKGAGSNTTEETP